MFDQMILPKPFGDVGVKKLSGDSALQQSTYVPRSPWTFSAPPSLGRERVLPGPFREI